jgi:hypothetical protein
VVDKTERQNERNAVLAGGGFHPVDRGPAGGPAEAADMMQYLKSWQFQVTGKPAAAAVLADVGAEHMKSGACCQAEGILRARCC